MNAIAAAELKGLSVPRANQRAGEGPAGRRTEQYLRGCRPPYRLNVLGADVVDVVQSIGGWLYDQTTAGWYVSVRLVRPGDIRPLTILGVGAVETGVSLGEDALSLAVGSEVLARDEQLFGELLDIIDRGASSEITVWGTVLPAEIEARLGQVDRRVSASAKAFKAHALLAATGRHITVESVERCRGRSAQL
jgi:hypothetical protein